MKFSRRILRPNTIPNNELLDFLSRVPDNEEIVSWDEEIEYDYTYYPLSPAEPVQGAAPIGGHRSGTQQSQEEAEGFIVHNQRWCGSGIAAVQRNRTTSSDAADDDTLPRQYQPTEAQVRPGQEPQHEPGPRIEYSTKYIYER